MGVPPTFLGASPTSGRFPYAFGAFPTFLGDIPTFVGDFSTLGAFPTLLVWGLDQVHFNFGYQAENCRGIGFSLLFNIPG